MKGDDEEPFIEPEAIITEPAADQEENLQPTERTKVNFIGGAGTSPSESIRTSSTLLTAANIIKMQIGISFISISKSISMVGIYASFIGFFYTILINIWSVWLILQARNKFKNDHQIIDICDLSVKLYGEKARKYFAFLLVVSNCLFGMAYEVYFGS